MIDLLQGLQGLQGPPGASGKLGSSVSHLSHLLHWVSGGGGNFELFYDRGGVGFAKRPKSCAQLTGTPRKIRIRSMFFI